MKWWFCILLPLYQKAQANWNTTRWLLSLGSSLKKDLACLSYLPMMLLREDDTGDINDLLFPSMDKVTKCLSLNNDSVGRYLRRVKFCYGTVYLKPFEFIADPETDIEVGVSVGMCVPDKCSSETFARLFDLVCQIPECRDLQSSSLVSACSKLQPVLCGPLDRFKFEHRFQMTCLKKESMLNKKEDWKEQVSLLREEIAGVQNLLSDISHSDRLLDKLVDLLVPQETQIVIRRQLEADDAEEVALIEQNPRSSNTPVSEDGFDRELDAFSTHLTPPPIKDSTPQPSVPVLRKVDLPPSAFVSDALITEHDLESLIACGSNTMHNMSALYPYSGKGLQDLGVWERCPHDQGETPPIAPGGRYCLMRYFGILGSGHCLASSCTTARMTDLAKFICGLPKRKNFTWQTCLDMTNLLPLDLCLMIQTFGCNDVALLIDLSSHARDSVEALVDVLAPRRKLHSVNSFFANHLPSVIATLSRRKLSHKSRETSREIIDLRLKPLIRIPPAGQLSCQAFCDYTSSAWTSWDFRWSLVLLLTTFIVLPSASILFYEFSQSRQESDTKLLMLGKSPDRWRRRMSKLTTSIPSAPGSFLSCFHPQLNFMSYLKTVNNVSHGEFPHLSGLRVLSMIWIVLGHSFAMLFMTGIVSNFKMALTLIQAFEFQPVLGAVFAVDSFFFFTGFLMAVYGGPSLKNNTVWTDIGVRKLWFNLKVFFFSVLHRYVRLGGVYFIVLALYMHFVPYLSSGPLWPAFVSSIRDGQHGGCGKYWWTNVLFINNLVPESGIVECMPWSWYLANDFQFFVVSTVLLLVRQSSTKAFKFSCVALFVVCYGISTIIVVQNKLTSAIFGTSFNSGPHANLDGVIRADTMYYFKPWCRFPPHLIGVIWGMAFRNGYFKRHVLNVKELQFSDPVGPSHSRQESGYVAHQDSPSTAPLRQLDSSDMTAEGIRRCLIPCIHVTAIAVMLTCLYIEYGPNNDPTGFWPRWCDVLYQVFSRSIWASCLGWFCVCLAYAIPESREKPASDHAYLLKINSLPHEAIVSDTLSRGLVEILSCKPFILAAPFCYCLYLIHPVVQVSYFASALRSVYLTEDRGYFETTGFVLVTSLLAVPFTIMVEISLSKCFKQMGL
eukprot:Blabericola_migrator_1__4718@NODE_248_length_10892_cov_157_608222_g209_i0_p1_GENE_NODE_248_length_10892_cov_157_608222_g209_i0NODE_248_length_10892_cov_157_608222_g209_i0_p1_ORF_typecomplete_len1120_score161_09Acyl_transf_3/PF01757_22/7_3e02Acyl_transf_3/PF01757_22/2_8e27_NODE_248_length_10892_cov_157_608222_g209_i043687727